MGSGIQQSQAIAILGISIMLATFPVVAKERVVLDVSIVGIESLEGEIVIAVFDNDAAFAERLNPVAFAYLPVGSAVVRWSTELIAPATYAVAVYHDLNGNRELDMRPLGGPREPYGFSNNARRPLGPPGFDDVQISIGLERFSLEIEVR